MGLINNQELQQKYKDVIAEYRLIDDLFARVFFDGQIKETLFVLSILLDDPNLKLKNVVAQKVITNLQGRSVELDVYAEAEDGRLYDLEVQRSNSGAGPHRLRYYSGIMDANTAVTGEEKIVLPDTHVIFITENDVRGKGLPRYHEERVQIETGELFNDGAHIMYANGTYRGDDPMGKLMHDFLEPDPDQMYYPELAERMRLLKGSEKEVDKMALTMDQLIEEVSVKVKNEGMKEGRKEGRKEGKSEERTDAIRRMLRKWSVADVLDLGYTMEEIEQAQS